MRKVSLTNSGCNGVWLLLGFIASVLLAVLRARAGVTVIQNVATGATSWPGSPIIQTVSNPASLATVGESFNAVGGCTNYGQTFTIVTTNYTLQTISIYAGGGTGTGGVTNLTLRLFDLGSQSAPNPSPYAPGTDLFNSGNGLTINYAPQTAGVLQFDFTGNDRVTLTNGRMYAFEINGVINSSPLLWQRTVSETYGGGAAYRNRSWINGINAREFALAVYGAVAGSTNNSAGTWPNGIVSHAFTGQDGANLAAGLALSGNVLVGATLNGGTQGAGAAFYLTPDGSNFVTFRSFGSAADASNPEGEFAVVGNGLFGASLSGGSAGAGSVFVVQTNGSTSSVRSFSAVSADNGTNNGGASPSASLAVVGNLLFGTTTAGGAAGNGTIFSVSTNGTAFSVLHNFTALNSQDDTNADGASPWGGLILSGDKLYGTASIGGAGGNGVVFSMGTNGANFTALYNFSPMEVSAATNADGAIPLGGLVSTNGTLYGTTFTGGLGGSGTIYSLQTNGANFTVLHHFTSRDLSARTNNDGAAPSAGLILTSNVLYGTTSAGGTGAAGTVFSLNFGSGQFTAHHHFAPLASSGTNVDGAFPVAPVLKLGTALYGTAFGGGPSGLGTVFRIPLPTPAVITSIIRNLDGSVTLSFLGSPNSTNVTQSASVLTSPVWQSFSTNIAAADGAWQVTDTNNSSSTKFYRSYAP